MKKILIMLMIIGMIATSMAVADERTFQAGKYDPEGKLVSVIVNGLVCEFCATSLEKVFLKEDGVSGININMSTKEVLLSMNKDKFITNEKITELVEWAGYDVESIDR